MKRLLISCLCSILTLANAIAGRYDRGRDYSVRDGDSSSGSLYLFAIIALIGYGAYNVFKKDENDTSGRGCLASIIAVVVAFILFSMIFRACK